jgi:hypothetical protein
VKSREAAFVVLATGLAVSVSVSVGHAQGGELPFGVTGYLQNVPVWTNPGPFNPGGFSDFSRLRVMATPSYGDFTVQVAYEHALTLRENEAEQSSFVGRLPGGAEWLDLQWTLADTEHADWSHRFDRLAIGWTPASSLELTVGRQAVSWATTLYLTPADPFAPFDPADPFREYRSGIDAARFRIYPGPLSEIDFVVRPVRSALGEEMTALGRGLTTWKGWELSGWGGALHDDLAAAGGAAGSWGPFALRGEAVVRRSEDEGTIVRATFGLDRRFSIARRDLYLVFEYQHDGLGAGSPREYLEVLDSEPFLRGELQVLGRDETAVQVSYQIHRLWSVAGLWLWNWNDRSALVAPSFSYSASDEASVSGGLFVGIGESAGVDERALSSEFGQVPVTAYFAVSLFF